MNVSLAIESLSTADALASAARNAAATGFNALELQISSHSFISFETPPATCHELSKIVTDTGLFVSALKLPREPEANLASAGTADRRRAYERSIVALDRAQWLGTSLMILTPAIIGGPPDRLPPGRYEETYGRAVESMLSLRFEAQQRGVHVACAINETRFLLSPTEARGFIDRVNSPFVGLSLELGSLLPLGYPSDWIASLGHRVFHCYATDRRRDESSEACLIGDGDVEWPAVRDAMTAARLDGPLTLPNPHDPREALQRIRRHLDRPAN